PPPARAPLPARRPGPAGGGGVGTARSQAELLFPAPVVLRPARRAPLHERPQRPGARGRSARTREPGLSPADARDGHRSHGDGARGVSLLDRVLRAPPNRGVHLRAVRSPGVRWTEIWADLPRGRKL